MAEHYFVSKFARDNEEYLRHNLNLHSRQLDILNHNIIGAAHQCNKGLPVWILDKGRLLQDGDDGENLYCLLIGIKERKQEQEALRLLLERHQVIVDQASDLIFDWDMRMDEFLIYLSEVTDGYAVLVKTQRLPSDLEVLMPALGATPISSSLGGDVFPHGTIDYYALYKCADLSLYSQKKNGRKGMMFYRPDISEKSFCGNASSAVGADVVADVGNVLGEQLAQYAFRMLYAAKDIESTNNRLLEMIGRSYDVSSAYVFESPEDRKCCSNTFERCDDGVKSLLATLQNISYVEELGDYLRNFDQNALFYCAQVNATQPDVRAVLSTFIMKLRQKQGISCYPTVLKSAACKKPPQERTVKGMITRKIRASKKLISKRAIFRLVMSLLLAGLAGWWSIPSAEAVRGYYAVGGEYCLIMMMGALPWFFSGFCIIVK